VTEPEAVQTAAVLEQNLDEDPTVIVYADGTITANRPYALVTAAFGDIESSILADLSWYVDGTLISQETDRLLVEGSTVTCQVDIDPTQEGADTAQVQLVVEFNDKSLTGEMDLEIDRVGDDAETIVIQTEEIPVTAKKDTAICTESDLEDENGELSKGDSGLLLEYTSGNSGMTAIRLQFSDGTSGWVSADDVTISDGDYTTDEDYSEEAKTDFVNSMRYDSETEYMVWVSLYTQKVNVFSGYQGNWVLEKTFDCATGSNSSPTSTGTYTYSTLKDRWDLGTTYVEPVLIFNGGEAFTSRPYSADTDEIADETMGEPASGGSVRMLEEDIAWMKENLTIGSLVVIY
jgi:lipoprotein-anchoring transpeptidase ErfK/SrfK